MTSLISLSALLILSAVMTNTNKMSVPREPPNRPQGIKALEVRPGRVPFTTNDVTQYVRTHRLAKSVGELSQLQVESLEFITAHDASIRLEGVSIGVPSSQRLGFAIIRGPLYFTGPPGSKPTQFERGYALFDTASGNLLMSGTLNLAKKPR